MIAIIIVSAAVVDLTHQPTIEAEKIK